MFHLNLTYYSKQDDLSFRQKLESASAKCYTKSFTGGCVDARHGEESWEGGSPRNFYR